MSIQFTSRDGIQDYKNYYSYNQIQKLESTYIKLMFTSYFIDNSMKINYWTSL